MAFEVRIPQLGESVTEAVVVRWAKDDGDTVDTDDLLLELETDKASVEIPAERAGVLRIRAEAGATVQVGDVVGVIEEGDGAGAKRKKEATEEKETKKAAAEDDGEERKVAAKKDEKGGKKAAAEEPAEKEEREDEERREGDEEEPALSPAVRRLLQEHDLDADEIPATGPKGRLTKGDVLAYVEDREAEAEEEPEAEAEEKEEGKDEKEAAAREAKPERAAPRERERGQIAPRAARPPAPDRLEREERVPMGRIRARIAERLVAAQQTAAILTTFNEIDMSAVLDLRAQYKEVFEEKHGVRLGFMSFFAAACCRALEEVPAVNAEIDGDEIVYRRYVNLGIAVGTERGLVVPVVKDADRRSLAEVESEIGRLAERARAGKLSVDELTGGTFTISNGGVYGSLMSTPILNPPQSGILGMHKIEKRAVVVDDAIAIRPMMYVALSYDHRLVDGEQAVTFLVRVKEQIEDPARLVLGI